MEGMEAREEFVMTRSIPSLKKKKKKKTKETLTGNYKCPCCYLV